MEKNFRDWYSSEGCSQLNKLILELQGKGIGRIPLENLLPAEFCGQEYQQELLTTIQHDGVDFEEVDYTDGSMDLFIFVK